MSWECCLIESRWRYNELLIRTQSSVTSLFSTVFGDRQQVFLSESGTSLLLQFWSVPLLVFLFSPSFSLSVSLCLLPYSLDECDEVGPCERVLNRTDADCAWKRCVRRELENMKKAQKTSFHSDIDPATQFLLFFASPFENGHESLVRHGKTRTKQTSVSYQQHLNWLQRRRRIRGVKKITK